MIVESFFCHPCHDICVNTLADLAAVYYLPLLLLALRSQWLFLTLKRWVGAENILIRCCGHLSWTSRWSTLWNIKMKHLIPRCLLHLRISLDPSSHMHGSINYIKLNLPPLCGQLLIHLLTLLFSINHLLQCLPLLSVQVFS